MFRASDDIVKRFMLSHFPRMLPRSADHVRRVGLPAMQNIRQDVMRHRQDQHMHMVGHDNPVVQAVSATIKMGQRFSHDGRTLRVRQNALALSLIKPGFDPFRE